MITPEHPSYDVVRRVAARDPRYAALLPPGTVTESPPPRASRFLPECTFLGERLPGPCGAALYRCKFDGAKVTRVGGCKDGERACTTCPHRVPPRKDPWANPVLVPEPPPIDVTPVYSKAVVTVAVGESGRSLLRISEPGMREYAEAVGADFVVLTWPGHPDWPMSGKFQVPKALDLYDRIAYLDADVLVNRNTVDLFDACSPQEVGGYDDLAGVLRWAPGFIGDYQRARSYQGLPACRVPYYLNAGVMVLSKCHIPVMTHPQRPVPPAHCNEQHWWISRLHDTGVPVKLLPRVYNWQWWEEKWMDDPPKDAVLHFSGMADDGKRLEEMDAYVKKGWGAR